MSMDFVSKNAAPRSIGTHGRGLMRAMIVLEVVEAAFYLPEWSWKRRYVTKNARVGWVARAGGYQYIED